MDSKELKELFDNNDKMVFEAINEKFCQSEGVINTIISSDDDDDILIDITVKYCKYKKKYYLECKLMEYERHINYDEDGDAVGNYGNYEENDKKHIYLTIGQYDKIIQEMKVFN